MSYLALNEGRRVLNRAFSQVSRSDLESQSGPTLVNLSGMELDPLLTEAFHDPSILATARDFVAANNRFVISSSASDPLAQTKGLIIGWATTKTYLVWLVLLFSIISLAIGSSRKSKRRTRSGEHAWQIIDVDHSFHFTLRIPRELLLLQKN